MSADAICTLLISSLPTAIHHLYDENDPEFCSQMDESLRIVAAQLVGVKEMIGALRTKQLDDVMESWRKVYSKAKVNFACIPVQCILFDSYLLHLTFKCHSIQFTSHNNYISLASIWEYLLRPFPA